jgi:hypothetical protein
MAWAAARWMASGVLSSESPSTSAVPLVVPHLSQSNAERHALVLVVAGGVGGIGPGAAAGMARPWAIRLSSSATPVVGVAGTILATGRPYSLTSSDSSALIRSSTLAVC